MQVQPQGEGAVLEALSVHYTVMPLPDVIDLRREFGPTVIEPKLVPLPVSECE